MTARDLIDLSSQGIRQDVATTKAAYEAALLERSEELANARSDEDYECMANPRPDRYPLDCGCVWERGCGYTKECSAHE